jgi:hypothetical protein
MQTLRRLNTSLLCALACACLLAPAAAAQTPAGGGSGGASPDDPLLRPPGKALLVGGKAIPPAGAPPEVVGAIMAANRISTKPYRYGGGHGLSFRDSGYDCSGAISYALHGGGLLDRPLHSGLFMRWGERGRGRWITVYAHGGHAYVTIAGLRFDTGGRDRGDDAAPGSGPRWSAKLRSSRGYRARHPEGF